MDGVFLDATAAAAALARLPRAVVAWIQAEQARVTRRVDRRVLDPGAVNALPPEFRPESQKVWRLPAYWVREDAVSHWSAGHVDRRFQRSHHGIRQVLVLRHPLAVARAPWVSGAEPGPLLVATASASARTVFAWTPGGGAPFLAKLSLPVVLAGEYRGLGAAAVASSVGKTRLLDAWPHSHDLQFLREPFGVVRRAGTEEEEGYLVRELPAAVRAGRRTLRPFLALTNPSRDGEPPLLHALARACGQSLVAFARRALLEPFLDAYVDAAVRLGMAAEAHGQNLLVELEDGGRPTGRFYLRDMEGVSLDLAHLERVSPSARRRIAALPVVHNRDEDYDALDHAHAARQGLHTFFVGGPLFGLACAVRRRPGLGTWRRSFAKALLRAMRRHGPGAPPDADAEAWWRWLEGVRWRRAPQRPVPRALRTWLHLEQRVNDRVRHPRLFALIALDVLPAHLDPRAASVVDLASILVPAAEVELAPDPLPPALARHLLVRRDGQTLVRFPIHPAAHGQYALDIAEYGLERGVLCATATSSPRSLVVWARNGAPRPFGIKLSVDVDIQRLPRVLRVSKLARARAVTRALEAIPRPALAAAGLAFLREPATLRLRHRDDGTILRELPTTTQDLVPGFSLFAVTPGGAGILLRHSETASSLDEVLRHVVDTVFCPLVRAGAFLFFQQGLVPDLHQQNVLFRTDGRLVLRDLDSVRTDVDLRLRRGWTLQPWLDAPGTCDDLKLADTPRWYDDPFRLQVRAEWVFLTERLLTAVARARGWGGALRGILGGHLAWRAMDALLLEAAAHHLGVEVVVDELRHVVAHGPMGPRAARQRALAAVTTPQHVGRLIGAWPAAACLHPHDVEQPRYSLNAMVHAWRARHPLPRGERATGRQFAALARAGRSTVSGALRAAAQYTRTGGVLVAWDRAGRPVAFGLPHP